MSTQPVETESKWLKYIPSLPTWAKWLKPYGLLLVCGLIAVLFFSGSAIHYTSQTEFCMACHEMDTAVQSWRTSPHGSNEAGIITECKDCHVPVSVIGTLTTKVQNLRQPFIHFTQAPTPFEYSLMRPGLAYKARADIRDENCLECHNLQQMVPKNQRQIMAHSTSVGISNCASCHNSVGHSPSVQEEGVS